MSHTHLSNLTPAQLDGIACVVCAAEGGTMICVGVVDGGQVFAHRACAGESTSVPTVLVVGRIETADDVADLTAHAFDAADRLQMASVVATSMDFNVDDFTCVVLTDDWLDSTPSVVLGVEALRRDMCVLTVGELHVYEPDTTCGHCGTVDVTAAPRRSDDGWTTSVCDGCIAAHARTLLPGLLPVAA